SEAEMADIAMPELLGAEPFERARLHIAPVLEGESQLFQRELIDRDGRPVHMLISCIPDRVDGVVRGFLVLMSDISEIKRAELRLQEVNGELMLSRDKAEAANR